MKKYKGNKNSINPVIVGVIAFGAGYALSNYLAKKKLADVTASLRNANALDLASGKPSTLQTTIKLLDTLNSAGWLDSIGNTLAKSGLVQKIESKINPSLKNEVQNQILNPNIQVNQKAPNGLYWGYGGALV